MRITDNPAATSANAALEPDGDANNAAPTGNSSPQPLPVPYVAASNAPWATRRSGLSTQPVKAPTAHRPGTRQSMTHESPSPADLRDTASLKLNNASVNLQTGITQLHIASRSFSSEKYLDGLHAAIAGLGKVINAGGEALAGTADLVKLQGGTSLGELLESGANYLNSTGTPLKAFGAVLKDLDTALRVFVDPTQTPRKKDLAFKRALSTIIRETGDTVTTLNETTGSASRFANALGSTLASTGNIGSGITIIRQNSKDFAAALHQQDFRRAAIAGTGTLTGACFLGGGLTQAIGKALTLAGYEALGERVYRHGEYMANYGEKLEAFQDLLEPGLDEARHA
jgi:hypothetical protein